MVGSHDDVVLQMTSKRGVGLWEDVEEEQWERKVRATVRTRAMMTKERWNDGRVMSLPWLGAKTLVSRSAILAVISQV